MNDNEKPPVCAGGQEEQFCLPISEYRDTIAIYPRGVKTKGYTPRVRRSKGAGGVRGAIVGWSAASRRRFREWLLTHESKNQSWGVTLTIPGEPITPEDWKRAFRQLTTRCIRAKVGLVWRLELQQRGQPHIHCIATTPHFGESVTASTLPAFVEFWWWKTWSKILNSAFPECAGLVDLGGEYVQASKASRSLLAGARQHAVRVEADTGGGLWWRYLCDHATKTKQAQLCTWHGFRHWGVINKTAFRDVEPEKIAVCRKVFVSVYRWIRNSTRRRIHDERAPFGYRKGVSPRRSCAGSSVWFGVDADMVEKLLVLAASNMKPAGAGYSRLGGKL